MKTNFNFDTGEWTAAGAARASQHDLIFRAPPCEPVKYGIPLGSGELGALLWCEPERLVIAMNRADLVDDRHTGDFSNWAKEEEERSTVQRFGCRLTLDFGQPVFDEFWLSDFFARLSIGDGLFTLRSVTSFGTVSLEAFVTPDDALPDGGVLVCRVKTDMGESAPVKLCIERFGSRSFAHWYGLIRSDTASGTQGTSCSAEGGHVFITQELPRGVFTCGVSSAEHTRASRLCSRRGELDLTDRDSFTFFAGITPPMQEGSADRLAGLLAKAKRTGFDALYQKSAALWAEFWSRSFIDSGDAFADDIWYLDLFYMRESQTGEYPGRFIDGLWGAAGDYQAWDFYFHWNQQELYWPLRAAGHAELCDSWLNYRLRSLPVSMATAKQQFSLEGAAFVSDVCDANGYNSLMELNNHTPAGETALDLWRQYLYTGDTEYLRTKALPYMLAAARYTASLYEKDPDGLWHAAGGTGYEGWLILRDAVTELCCGKTLFRAVLRALDIVGETVPEYLLWKEMAANMAPYLRARAPEELVRASDGVYIIKKGPFKGRKLDTDMMISSGFNREQGRNMHCREIDGIFPTADTVPIFPAGDIGIADRGTTEYELARNTELIYADICMGWDPSAVSAARLGLGEEANRLISLHIGKWLWSCNGFGHYGLGAGKDYNDRFGEDHVTDADTGEGFTVSEWLFRHIGLECSAVISCALNETLLQSHEGVIRVFPAIKKGQNARFTLYAEGGFVVSAQAVKGKPVWASVKSLRGAELRFASPSEDKKMYLRRGYKNEEEIGDPVFVCPTSPGEVFLFTFGPGIRLTTVGEEVRANDQPRLHPSGRILGRMPCYPGSGIGQQDKP